MEKLLNIVVGKVIGELCSKSCDLQLVHVSGDLNLAVDNTLHSSEVAPLYLRLYFMVAHKYGAH